MAFLFDGGKQSPTRINGIQITQSKQGLAVPVVMGQGKIQQSLLWIDGLHDVKVSQGGGKGGGKGGSEYLYSADCIAALANGPILSIANVWSGQTWLSTLAKNETITVASVYAPSSAAILVANNGVGLANTYSQSYTDYGAPASTVLSGTDLAPMVQVAYGTSLTTGEYSINPASIGTFTLTAVANASGGNTVYTGTFTGGTSPYASGASNAYIGFAFIVTGFTNGLNNGTFTCVASSASSVTLNNPNGVAASQAAHAQETGNTYHFAAADVGKTAQISYQFKLQEIQATEIDLIPSGKTITLGGTYTPTIDRGVMYYNNGDSRDGKALTSVSTNPPTVTGTYHFKTPGTGSSGGADYIFSTGDIAAEVLISYGYENLGATSGGIDSLLTFELFGGGLGQAIAPYMLSGHSSNDNTQQYMNPAFPGAALGYSNTAYVLFYPMDLGAAGEIQDNIFEIITPDSFGGGIVDCNPIQCVLQVLTNSVWGLGSGSVPFPTSVIDNGGSGTWGGPAATPGARSTASTAWNWFAAQSFFISPVIDSQDSASSLIGKWLEAGMCAAFMSEGLLKMVPYGDTSAAANGCTWTAPSNFVVALDDTCFISKEGDDPVKIVRSAWQDANNKVQVQFKNRLNQYADEITIESDQAAINRYGLRLEDPQSWGFITMLPAATFAANMRVKRSVNQRNAYTFVLPYSYSYLECMDIVPITTSSVWAAGLNNADLGITNLPVRIQKIVDDPVNGLEITAEDYLWGSHQPVIFNKGLTTGNALVNTFADPGNTEVVMFEATNRLTGYSGNEIWIGAVGVSDNWGSVNIWVSQDGTKYLQVGTIETPARLGELDTTFASGSDPDTTNSLVVDMAENTGQLDAGTDTDADLGTTLCFCDGEIISYSACAISGQDQYTMNGYIRRGQMGSTISSHAGGSLFMRLDGSVFKYTYDPTFASKTLYFKFQSVNIFGNSPQDLSTLTAVSFVVPGVNPGAIDASSGLVLTTSPTVGAGALGWTPAVS